MVSEHEIVQIYRKKFGLKDSSHNDVETMRVGNRLMVVKTDTLVYGTDVPEGMTHRQAGRKAAIACVSDFASKGVRPRWALVSVTAPPSLDARAHRSIAAGLADAADSYEFAILGGDTNRGDETSITVSMMGLAKGIFRSGRSGDTPKDMKDGQSIPSRGGAMPGESVYASGPFGLSAAGLYAIQHGVKGPRGCIRAVMMPRPRLNFGAWAARNFGASIDSSDGLSSSLHEIAARSGVAIIVNDDPAAEGVAEFAAKHGIDPDELVYNGGEEYEIVFTRKVDGDLFGAVYNSRTPLTHIGTVEEGEGVYIQRGGRRLRLADGGWKAFE